MTDIPILDIRIAPPITIKPIHNFVLLQKLDDETSLIQAPSGVTKPLQQWEVLEVAEDVTVVKKGDHVLLAAETRLMAIDHENGIGLVATAAIVGIVS